MGCSNVVVEIVVAIHPHGGIPRNEDNRDLHDCAGGGSAGSPRLMKGNKYRVPRVSSNRLCLDGYRKEEEQNEMPSNV